MSNSERRLEHVYAETWAGVILKRLMRGIDGRRACDDGIVAGSVRRRCETVGDIEIVLLPVWDAASLPTSAVDEAPALELSTNLFGETARQAPEPPPRGACSLLDATIEAMVAEGCVRKGTPWGQKQRRLIPNPYPDIPLELYLADRSNFGNIAMIRTGSADFSKGLASSWVAGGVLPAGLRQDQGYLWRVDEDGNKLELIACRTEREYFVAAGVPWVDPALRDADAVKRLRSYVRSCRREVGRAA